jgi:transposase
MVEDESGLSLIPLMGRSWAPRGCTPTIRHNSHWEKLSAIAGITLDGELHFKVHDGSIRSAQIVEYLEQLLRYIPEKHIVLLWDGSRTHTSNATKTFLKEHADRMTAFRLPPYSPSFNPVELLWAEIKWGRMRGFCPKNTQELKRKLYSCISSLRRKTPLIRSYFNASDLPIGRDEETKLCRYQ